MTDRLRVTMLLTYFPTTQGGAERQVASLAPLLARRGVDLTVISRHRGSSGDFPHADVRQIRVPEHKALGAAGFVAGAVRQIHTIRPHVLHAHSLLSPSTAAGVAGVLTRTPVVAKVLLGGRGGEVERLRSWRRGGLVRVRALRAAIDRFIVISDEIDRELGSVGVPAAQRVTIPNGVDTERFVPAAPAERDTARAALGLASGPTAVFVGRLNPQKGLDVLLEAWRRVRGEIPRAQLLIIGEGHLHGTLEAHAPAGVSFLGRIGDVAPYLRAADAFVLPSLAEGLSNALLEASAAGLPCVVTDVGAAREVLGDHGRIVPPGDVGALANGLLDVLSDPGSAASSLGAGARRSVEERFALSATADRLVELYREVSGIGG